VKDKTLIFGYNFYLNFKVNLKHLNYFFFVQLLYENFFFFFFDFIYFYKYYSF